MSLRRAYWSEGGQASVEYAMLAMLISIAAIGVMAALGIQVQGLFDALLAVYP